MNIQNRLKKLEANLSDGSGDSCNCFMEQTRQLIDKVYAGEPYAAEDYPALDVTRRGSCEICRKPIDGKTDAETVATINEIYGEAAI